LGNGGGDLSSWDLERTDGPGTIYVKLLSALSICDTAPAFFVMKSPYMSMYGRKLFPAAAGGEVSIAMKDAMDRTS